MRWCFVAVVTILCACGGNGEVSAAEYRDDATDALRGLDLERVIILLEDATDESALVLNEAWKDDMRDALDTWRTPHAAIEDMNPPTEAEDAHDALLIATECFSDTAGELETMVDDERLNPSRLTPLFESCTSMLDDVMRELDALPDA